MRVYEFVDEGLGHRRGELHRLAVEKRSVARLQFRCGRVERVIATANTLELGA